MRIWSATGYCLILLLYAAPSSAALAVFACEPEWGALAKELGGESVEVYVATTARQDPHRIEARPSLIARARGANLVVCTGAELEAGWLPLVLSQSGNPQIQVGRPGYLEAARHVTLLDVPRTLDRAQGDVHAAGNPHVHLDPRNIATIASVLSERMQRLDPGSAQRYAERAKDFRGRWLEAIARWERRGASLAGMPLVVQHKDLTYLLDWLRMREVGTLEPKPGLPPTTAHLGALLTRLGSEPAQAVVRSAYSDPRAAEWLAERARIPAVTLPYTVGGSERAKDLFGLFDDTLARLLAVPR